MPTTDVRPVALGSSVDPQRIARLFPSFHDFVDDALFHPAWGYYSTGQVRFGEGGHYDTFPLALSPLFGRMLAQYAFRSWSVAGRPQRFEICELGAGNGQLCMDTLLALRTPRGRAWSRFADAVRYRIVERSPALIERQGATLGPLAASVRWTHADLAQPGGARRFGASGLVFANEVLDCLSHHKIVPQPDKLPGVVFVIPVLEDASPSEIRRLSLVRGIVPAGLAVPRERLAAVMTDASRRARLRFCEVIVPLQMVPGLLEFVHEHYPELFGGQRFRPCFVCPGIATLIRRTARLYDRAEALWIDYGGSRAIHLGLPASQRIFAGPPRSGASVYRDPGFDDITFLVDFSVVAHAAYAAGLEVAFYGRQGALARRSSVELDAAALELIVQHRALEWMLALVGVGPERAWRRTGLTWSKNGGTGMRLRTEVKRSIAEFCGERTSNFKLMILRSPPLRARTGKGAALLRSEPAPD